MSDMFSRLEQSLKGYMATLHGDQSQILKRVEDTEEKLDTQTVGIKELKEQIKKLKTEQRNMLYRLEDQENRSRRENLRIRGFTEKTEEEDLQWIMDKVFGPLLGRSITAKIKIEKVHRIRTPASMAREIPRDVIVRFHNYKDKEQIWEKLRTKYPIKYEETVLQIFPDLSP